MTCNSETHDTAPVDRKHSPMGKRQRYTGRQTNSLIHANPYQRTLSFFTSVFKRECDMVCEKAQSDFPDFLSCKIHLYVSSSRQQILRHPQLSVVVVLHCVFDCYRYSVKFPVRDNNSDDINSR